MSANVVIRSFRLTSKWTASVEFRGLSLLNLSENSRFFVNGRMWLLGKLLVNDVASGILTYSASMVR